MRKHLGLLFIGFILGVLTFGFINFQKELHNVDLLMSGLLGVLVSYSIFHSNKPLNSVFDWKSYTGFRLLLGILFHTAIGFTLIWLGTWLVRGNGFFEAISLETGLKLGILLFCAAIIYNIIYFAFFSYNQFARNQVAELKTERKQAELQLETLKSQLSPHFLFNCINSLSFLFHDDVEKAESFIRSMANSYQYTLENCRSSLISLKQELDFLESYSFLLKTRFNGMFELKYDLNDKHLSSKIPPLTLQLLVENAIKHNKLSVENPILIQIKGYESTLSVSNTKAATSIAKKTTGIGLKNIDKRYKILAKKGITIQNDSQFNVLLPMLTNE
ncbi:histidine kinase [Muricauda sp. DJ-13]|uniref:Histidine kinase n=2 Tax=Croceivirga thetidis TaxID=2721623 RepID=A0ABX1GTS9_9FLAO|nr:histidine kinase [Croceivirga thetidis]